MYRVPDGSSYAFSTLAIEERDPPLVSLEDINRRSKTFHETPIQEMKNLRVIKFNIGQLPDINKIQPLEYLIEVQARENAIANIEFMTGPTTDLQYLQKVDLSKN